MTDHREAVDAALRANPNLTVYQGPLPKGIAPPYVAYYVTIAFEERTKLDGPTDSTRVTITTHSVATTGQGVAIVARNVRAALIDKALTVTGALCTRITHENGIPPGWSDATGTVVLEQIDEWDYTARPS